MFAETESQQKQAFATRDAAKQQANMQYEAELSARRQALGATVLGATMAGFSPGGILNKGIGSLFNRKPETPNVPIPEMTETIADDTFEFDEPNFDLDPITEEIDMFDSFNELGGEDMARQIYDNFGGEEGTRTDFFGFLNHVANEPDVFRQYIEDFRNSSDPFLNTLINRSPRSVIQN